MQMSQTATDLSSSSSSFMNPVVLCILVTETAERFSYFGFRAILVLYFKTALQYEESTSIALFAYVSCLAYLSPLLGAILADGGLGRYRTILYFGSIYCVGMIMLTLGAFITISDDIDTDMVDSDGVEIHIMKWKRFCTFLGLFLVCMGTGGIKPCVSAFGADQVANAVTSGREELLDVEEEGSSHSNSIDNSFGPEQPLETTICDPERSDNQQEQDGHQVRAFFAYFYFCINLGAVTSISAVPILKARFGFGVAFLAPTIFLIFAMGAFLSKRKEYVHHIPGTGSSSLANTFKLCGWLLKQRARLTCPALIRSSRQKYASVSKDEKNSEGNNTKTESTRKRNLTGDLHSSEEENECEQENHSIPYQATKEQLADAAQTLHILPIISLLPIFWMLYDQQGSVWTLQATRMELHGLQPEQLTLVNPVEIMIFIPLFDRCIYPFLETRMGIKLSHLRRMGWGMLLCAISFFVSGLLESVIQSRDEESGGKVSIWWQLPQITILTVAEIFLSVTGYDFAYSNSPESTKAFIMAIYLLTTAIGDFCGGILYSSVFQSLNRATAMYICALLMIGNLGIFCSVSRWWEEHNIEESESAENGFFSGKKEIMMMSVTSLSPQDGLDNEACSRSLQTPNRI